MRRVAANFSDEELEKIDVWGFERRIRDRSAAIRGLVLATLSGTHEDRKATAASA